MIDPPKLKLTFFFYPKAYDRGEGLSMGLTASQGHEPVGPFSGIMAGIRRASQNGFMMLCPAPSVALEC
jgi:hypothetical protein